MRIGRILIPELETSSKIGRISECGTSLEIGWILIPVLVRGKVCFLGSGLKGQSVISLSLFTPQWVK